MLFYASVFAVPGAPASLCRALVTTLRVINKSSSYD